MCKAEERHLKTQLIELEREYRKKAEPYIKRLAEIEAMKPPPPIVINVANIDPSLLDKLKGL